MSSTSVKTCKRCLYNTTHPLGLVLDAEGICSGCRVHEEKDKLDWAERWNLLERLVKPYRSRDSRHYDCIVPVTGGGDSFFIVHLVKERLNLKPLLVTYNRHYNTPLGIRNLAQLRRRFDCDILIQSVNPISVKKIIQTTLRQFGSFHWPVLAGQSVFPVQTAVSHGVPLILWGAHQGLEQVGMFSHLHEVEMTRRYRKDHDLLGYEADDLISIFGTLSESDIWQYRYPGHDEISQIGVRGIYLGNYVRWDPLAQHQLMVKTAGYASAAMARTFDLYDHVDDWHYLDFHDLLKQRRHGYSKVVDHASREIRHGRIDRDHAIKLVRLHQSRSLQYQSMLLNWLNIDQSGMDYISTRFTRYPDEIFSQPVDHACPPIFKFSGDLPNATLDIGSTPQHITIGKGYPDNILAQDQ
jgi:N-acetyl sugar amidotransferase